jgi:hypothetical protein
MCIDAGTIRGYSFLPGGGAAVGLKVGLALAEASGVAVGVTAGTTEFD